MIAKPAAQAATDIPRMSSSARGNEACLRRLKYGSG
jgi:hypothetical protein